MQGRVGSRLTPLCKDAKNKRSHMPRRKAQATTNETHQTIEKQTADFLKSGGKITEIPYGTSGRPSIVDRKNSVYGRSMVNFVPS